MRASSRLSDLQVKALAKLPRDEKVKPLHDGQGLYVCKSGGSVSFVFKFMRERKSYSMGLGAYPHVSLADARERHADALKALKRDNVNPLAAKQAEERTRLAQTAKGMTFKEAGEAYIEDHKKRWTDPKAANDWKASLAWAAKIVGDLDVADIDRQLVLKVLKQEVDREPLWTARPVQAKRVRARMQAVLEWAVQSGARDEGPNPAEWSRLKAALPAHSRVHKVKHHEHVPVDAVPAFMASLVALEDTAAKALRFLLLTATRTGDVLGMKWRELDVDAARWVIPAERFKTRRAVRVPLSADALAILTGLKSNRDPNAYVFVRAGGPLSENALIRFMRKFHPTATPHGTARGAFRTWCASKAVPHEVAEAALGHVAGNAVVQAYQHSDFYEARVPVMESWATFCANLPKQPEGS